MEGIEHGTSLAPCIPGLRGPFCLADPGHVAFGNSLHSPDRRYRPVRTSMNQYRPVRTGTDWYRPVQTGIDLYRLVWTGTDWYRPVQTGTDWYKTTTCLCQSVLVCTDLCIWKRLNMETLPFEAKYVNKKRQKSAVRIFKKSFEDIVELMTSSVVFNFQYNFAD
ncbi:hypothetical protein BTVI_80861 [Pitangus sulphuratus]|nr:hypothetical protein BTVI_80861 [Pitangus sulphuratus]